MTVTNPDTQTSTLSSGFTVTAAAPPPPTLSSVNPTSGAQGQNLTGVILTGSNFQSGATCGFGAGITVNSCTFNSATQLTANITIGSTATLGSRNVIVTNPDTQSSTLSNAFSVTTPSAVSLIQKATFSRQPTAGGTVTLNLPQATGAGHTLIVGVSFWPLDISSVTDSSGDIFTRGLATSTFHNAASSATYINFYYAKSTAGGATSLTLNFTGGSTYLLAAVAEVAGLDPSAPLDQSGFHESLTATTAWSSASVTTTAANEYLFSWAATEASNPSCSSPASGWSIESQTNDSTGTTVCLLDRIVSATGSYQASVTASSAQNYAMEIATFKSGSSSSPPPTLSSINPNSGTQGQNLTSVILTGSNFKSGATCSFGAGITVNSCTFNSATQLTANITIGAAAGVGARNVTVTNPDTQTSTLSGGFTVTAGGPPPPPSLTSVNPTSGAQGQTLTAVVLTGSNFQSGATCGFGAGITVNSCTFNSATQLTANITIGSTATLGSRNVTVTNPDTQFSTLSNAFSVTTPSAISLIQKATFSRQPTAGGTVTFTLPQATGAGHTLIVGVTFWPVDVTSITDGSGDTFTRGLASPIAHEVFGSVAFSNFYYAKSTAGGTNSLTLNFSGGSTYLLVSVAEVAGLNTSAPFEQSAYRESLTPTAAWASAAITTTAANEYLFSWAATEGGSALCSNPASGWTIESQTNDSTGATVCLLDRIASASGSYQASANASPMADYAMEIVAFQSGSSSPPPPPPAPILTSINPNSGALGQTLTLILTGSNFQSGAVCLFGAGITVNSCTYNSPTQITVNISITARASAGPYNVTVTNPDGQASTLSNGFTVTAAGPPPPTLSSVSPNSGVQGQNLTAVVLTGSSFQSGATCAFGAGITVNSCTFNSATQLTANITIGAAASLGSRTVTVTNPDTQFSTLSNGFSVTAAGAPPPTLSSVNPTSGAQGQNLTSVVLSGSNFQSGATCSFGAGITVNSCTFNSATQLTANITIGSAATLGSRNITVTNPDTQFSTLSNSFTVTTGGPPPPPSLTSVNPTSGAQGQTLTGVILTGSNFQSGATCGFGAGITVNSCTFNSATQLTANITIGSTATLGSRNVTVTNPDTQFSTLSNAFSVTTPSAISLIQKATFSRQPTAGGTVTLNLPQATGAGHTLIVGVSFWPLDISSVTDSSGDIFTRGLATSTFHNAAGSATYINFYYAKSTAGGATSLTLNFTGGSTYLLVAVAEVAGLDPSAPLDQSGFHESLTATTAWSSASVATTAANEYLFSWAATEASNPSCSSPASGWSIESQTNDSTGTTVCLLDRIVSATGSYQASVTASSAQNYAMEIATFH